MVTQSRRWSVDTVLAPQVWVYFPSGGISARQVSVIPLMGAATIVEQGEPAN